MPEPVVLIAGLGQGPWAWQWVEPLLAGEHEVRTFVARGTGPLARSEPRRTVREMAADLVAELDGHSAHLAGLSMGGYVSLTVALEQPELVRSLFLIGTGPGGPDRVPRPKAVREAYEAAVTLPVGEYERATTPLSLAPGWPESNPERFEEIVAARIADGATLDTMWAHLDACYAYYGEGIPVERIATRAFVLHGAEDRVVPPENGRMLAARLPNARYEELPARGHNLTLEIPEEIAQRVSAWVKNASL